MSETVFNPDQVTWYLHAKKRFAGFNIRVSGCDDLGGGELPVHRTGGHVFIFQLHSESFSPSHVVMVSRKKPLDEQGTLTLPTAPNRCRR